MDDEFLPDEFVLDDAPDEDGAPKVIFAGPSDAPPVFRISPSAAQTSQRRPPYGAIALAVGAATLILAVTQLRRPHAESSERAALSVTKLEPSIASTAAAPATPVQSEPGTEASAAAIAAEAALEAKRVAQSELEKGHTQAAIEAGERAVVLDPTDAETWLILGAGYDQRKAYGEARRCFKACVRSATHGPRGECAALLR